MSGFLKTHLLRIFLSVLIVFLISGSVPLSAKDPPEKPTVYFGLIPLFTPQLMYERFQPLMDYLSATTPYRFKMRLAKDYIDIITLLEDGSVNIAFLGGVSYEVAKSRVDLIPLLKPLNPQGKPSYRSVIITREDKKINSLSDLKGRSFAFASRWSTSGSVVPLYYLYKQGVGLQGLSNYFHLRYHDSVAREVLKGSYDAGAVIESIAYSYKDKGLKFIFVSEPIPELVIVVRKSASSKEFGEFGEFIEAVKRALIDLDPHIPSDRDLMKGWGDEIGYGFTEARDSDYDGIRKMIKYLRQKGVYLTDDEN